MTWQATENMAVVPGADPGRRLLRRILGDVRPFWGQIAILFVVDLLATPLALLAPVPLKLAVDSVIGDEPFPGPLRWVLGTDPSPAAALAAIALTMLAIVALSQVQEMLSWLLHTRTGESITMSMRARLFRHAQRLSLAFHDRRGTTDSIYRIQYDTYGIQSTTIDGVLTVLSNLLTLGGIIWVTARISSQLAAVALIVVPVLFILTQLYKSRARRWHKEAKELESSALGVIQEVLTALRVVKAFGREDDEQERFVLRSQAGLRAHVRLVLADSAFSALITMTTGIGTALVLYLGVTGVREGRMTLGGLLLVMSYLTQLYGPLNALSRKVGGIQASLASAERTYELLDEQPDVPESPNAVPLVRSAGGLELRHVSFTYGNGHDVLKDVNFRIEPGTRLGIAGRTGAGKTTLVNLITRFYDPTRGEIHLDGQDLREIRLADLREQFGIVLQEPVLFSTSIAENIAYARPSASRAELIEAARAANAHEFITAFPHGYDTAVGERGLSLSGGERQRISLARAFLKDAPILILDEPTSSVDVRTEAAIMEAMERLMAGRTTLMIAHRLSTLDTCDARMVIDGGHIIDLQGAVDGDAPAPPAPDRHTRRPVRIERTGPKAPERPR